MYQFYKKSKMLFIIYTASVFVFALAYNICFHQSFQPDKECDVLSDSYSTVTFREEKPSVKELNQWESGVGSRYMMAVFSYSHGKTAAFTEEFFRAIGADSDCLYDMEWDEDTALVNTQALELCHEVNGKLYLKVQGVRYQVIATYQDIKDDGMQETFYYLNQNAKSLQDSAGYDYIILDPKGDSAALEKSFKGKFGKVSFKRWQGEQENTMDNRPFFVLVTVFCGILLSLNCIGFSHEWMKPLYMECGIRKMLGARAWQNHWLVFKRFLLLFFCAFLCGNVLAVLFLYLLSNMASFPATRNLVGMFLYWKSALAAGASVGVIGAVILEWDLFVMGRKNILKNIRG